jgi:hypothetical protein
MKPNAGLKLSKEYLELAPGETGELTFTVTNSSGSVENYAIEFSGLEVGWYELDWAGEPLYPEPPGNEATGLLRLTPPADTPAGSFNPVIEVFSYNRQEVLCRLPFGLNIKEPQTGQLELKLLPEQVRTSARQASFQLRVVNSQDEPATISLTVRGSKLAPTAVNYLVRPAVLEIPARGQAVSTVEARLQKRNWWRADLNYDFKVAGDRSGLEVSGRLSQRGMFSGLRSALARPWWVYGLVLVSILLIVTILIQSLMVVGGPETEPVVANKTSTYQGDNFDAHVCLTPNKNLTARVVMGFPYSLVTLDTADGSPPKLLARHNIRQLPGLFASLSAVSPNGTKVAYVTADDAGMRRSIIQVVNTTGFSAAPQSLPVGDNLWPSRPVWSVDEGTLAFITRNDHAQLELHTVSITDNVQKLLPHSDQLGPGAFYGDNEAGPVCWSRDGQQILVAAGPSSFFQDEIDPQKGTLIHFARAGLPPEAPGQSGGGLPGAVVEPGLQPAGVADCFVKSFSINEPRWAGDPLASPIPLPTPASPSALATTLPLTPVAPTAGSLSGGTGPSQSGAAGLRLTAAAMLLNAIYPAGQLDPQLLNHCLGGWASSFEWIDLKEASCTRDFVGSVNLQSFSWPSLDAVLSKGQPVVVELTPGDKLAPEEMNHYVVVVSGAGDLAATYRVADPWDGTNYKSLGFFFGQGYYPRQLITITSRVPPNCVASRYHSLAQALPGFPLLQSQPVDGILYHHQITLNFELDKATAKAAHLYKLSESKTPPFCQGCNTTAAGGPGQIQGFEVMSGTVVSQEGFYELVIEAKATATAKSNKLVTHFGISNQPPSLPLFNFASADFQALWSRTDDLIYMGEVSRSYLWGPQPNTRGFEEDYAEAAGGKRLVQYFDKSRMEITYPNGNRNSPYYITNGLLARELMSGQLQLGDSKVEQREPSEIGVAGDADDTTGPTYKTMNGLTRPGKETTGNLISNAIGRSGQQRDGTADFGKYQVKQAKFEPVTGHNIATPFWTYLNQHGLLKEGPGPLITGRIFEPVYYATGLPLTEAWWGKVKVGGEVRDVLVQAFERRVLTYTPSNSVAYQVEMGNVGQHYYKWRYGDKLPMSTFK